MSKHEHLWTDDPSSLLMRCRGCTSLKHSVNGMVFDAKKSETHRFTMCHPGIVERVGYGVGIRSVDGSFELLEAGEVIDE